MDEEVNDCDVSSVTEKKATDKTENNKKPTSGKEMQPEPEEKVIILNILLLFIVVVGMKVAVVLKKSNLVGKFCLTITK